MLPCHCLNSRLFLLSSPPTAEVSKLRSPEHQSHNTSQKTWLIWHSFYFCATTTLTSCPPIYITPQTPFHCQSKCFSQQTPAAPCPSVHLQSCTIFSKSPKYVHPGFQNKRGVQRAQYSFAKKDILKRLRNPQENKKEALIWLTH